MVVERYSSVVFQVGPASPSFDGQHSHGPCIQRLCCDCARLLRFVSAQDLRACIKEAKAVGCLCASAGRAAKVIERPALCAGQEHDVAGLNVAVHAARAMGAHLSVCNVEQDLHALN